MPIKSNFLKNKKTLLTVLILLTNINNISAEEKCESKTFYPLYECRNVNVCEGYKPDTLLYDSTKDPDYEIIPKDILLREKMLDNARDKYVTVMNTIYKCATIKIKINALDELIDTLLKVKKSSDVEKTIGRKFKTMSKESQAEFEQLQCKGISKKYAYSKFDVLKQGTWEMCKYRNYLEYLKELTFEIENLKLDQSKPTGITGIFKSRRIKNKAIVDEIDHIYKVFPVAFQAYSSYENNYIIHLYLLLIKADFSALKKRLHEALGPINQLGYKILNAMNN